jgi:hypothetical protein
LFPTNLWHLTIPYLLFQELHNPQNTHQKS